MGRVRDEGEPDISPRERRLLAGVMSGDNQRQAAIHAGYPPRSAATEASHALARPHMRQLLRAMLAAEGLDNASLVARLRDGLDNSYTYAISRDGVATRLGPDHRTRFQFLELAFKLQDALPNARLDVVNSGTIQVIHLQAEDSLTRTIIDVSPEAATSEPVEEDPHG